ncbi:family 20 glycosylhydrolase [Pseudactinotalea sp.]|uniref:family 20 glycosylhydrolase n=1 Tax=Pseudactinotalea sp. TaxID=1926260 RepID=UPI003B3A0BB1
MTTHEHAAASESFGAAADLPPVLPAITGTFRPTTGRFELAPGTRVVAGAAVAGVGQQLARDLEQILHAPVAVIDGPAEPGDVSLSIVERPGAGYTLTIDASVTVSAGTATGVLHGTKSLVQMLRQVPELPGGAVTDEPAYPERGLTICSGEIHISPAWIERVLSEMSYLKLNQVLLTVKMLSERYPQTRTWGYYSREQVASLVASAAAHGIDLVPQVNAPGHMLMWIENLPELQLLDRDGRADPMRLDISRPESLQFYTDLVDEYLEVFDSPYWHMGADEYMLHTSFGEYPQLAATAQRRWGGEATPDDLYIDFVNQVNRYVRGAHGKTLRIWNDGLLGRNAVVALDRDVVVEHWTSAPSNPTPPSRLLREGHRVMNASVDLYLTRGGTQMDTERLYSQGWHVGQFHLEEVPARELPVTGAKISLWPDGASCQTEHDVEDTLLLPLQFLAQATWTGELTQASFAEFRDLGNAIGRHRPLEAALRTPVPEGAYLVSCGRHSLAVERDSAPALVDGPGDSWLLRPTPDGYYRITHADAGTLEVVAGRRLLGVPMDDGAAVGLVEQSDSNLQKWQVRLDEHGVEFINAITQQGLDVSEGRLVQRPFDRSDTRWTLQRLDSSSERA